MIYLSAQPDENYFLWQIQVQIQNLKNLNFQDQYHILIGFKETINPLFVDLANKYHQHKNFQFFFHKDTRESNIYQPSLRPHLIKKHLKIFDFKSFFYFDCDVIFRELLDFSKLKGYYCSDTISYIGANYIKSKDEKLFKDLCDIVQINYDLVEKNELNSGGAQYIFQLTTYDFWDKVEKDSILLYQKMEDWNNKRVNKNILHSDIQSWCSDMWSILWNGWKIGYDFKIHDELNFCWATDYIDQWHKVKIFHNAGVSNEKFLFNKLIYKDSFPYQTNDLLTKSLNSNFSSYKYAEIIDELR